MVDGRPLFLLHQACPRHYQELLLYQQTPHLQEPLRWCPVIQLTRLDTLPPPHQRLAWRLLEF